MCSEKKCPRCGAAIHAEASFCPYCAMPVNSRKQLMPARHMSRRHQLFTGIDRHGTVGAEGSFRMNSRAAAGTLFF